MSLLELFFPIATVVLAVGCYTCYRTGKPARELLAEKRQEAADKKAREERDGRERNRLNVQTKEVLELLEDSMRDPQRFFRDDRYGSITRGTTKYPSLMALAEFLQSHKRLKEINMDQETRLDAQGKKLRELQWQMKDIMKALQMGQPVE